MNQNPTFPASPSHPDEGSNRPENSADFLQRILGRDVQEFQFSDDVERSAERLMRTYSSKPALAEWAYMLRHEIYDVFGETSKSLSLENPLGTDVQIERGPDKPRTVEEILKASPALQTKLALYRKLLLQNSEHDAEDSLFSYMGHHWQRHEQERESVNGAYDRASDLLAEKAGLEEQLTAVLARMFGHRKGDPDSVDVAERFALEQDIAGIEQRVMRIKKEKPEVAALLQHDEIQKRLHEYHNGGFMQFVSRRKLINQLLKDLSSAKPVALMLGESGTGKTALARELGKALKVNVTRDIGASNVPFKTLLFERGYDEKSDLKRFGPLLKAMTGYEDSRMEKTVHTGEIFFDDEFNTRPAEVQREILKFVAEAQPGRTVSVPGTTMRVLVQPRFVYLAAGNPPSSRYERNETPLEAYREVPSKLLVDYLEQTQEQPELYEAMVAALLDEKTGRLRVTNEKEVMPGFRDDPSAGKMVLDTDPDNCGVVWNFANAWKQTLLAFSHQATGLSKKDPTAALGSYHLDKIVLDIGKVLQWLRDFKLDRSAQKRGLACFLTEKLIEELEGQVHATPEEKALFAQFFKEHGIDLSHRPTEADFRASEPNILTPVQLGLLFPQVPRPSKKDMVSPADQSAFLRDGSEVRYKTESFEVSDHLSLSPGETVIIDKGQEAVYTGVVESNPLQPLLVRIGNQSYQLMGLNDIDEARTLLSRVRSPSAPNIAPPLREAKDIIEKGGGTFYGPESLKAMGLKAPDTLPSLPPREEIERYAAQGFDMRLEVSQAPDGKNITPAWMDSVMQKVFDALPDTTPKAGRVLWQDSNINWYKQSPETFYNDAALSTCWVFTSGMKTQQCTQGLLDSTKGKNYLQQTDELVTFIDMVYRQGGSPPKDIDVEGAMRQFQAERKKIEKNMSGSKWKTAADELAMLDFTQMFRPEAQEVLFYFIQTFLNSPPNKRERLLETLYTWTKTQGSDGRLVLVGECDSRGARVGRGNPDATDGSLGALVVRKFRALKP